MDPLHQRLARLALATAGDYGFCLAGGYAVQAHGFLDRPSEDVDLFTTSAAEEQFPDAVATVIAAYKGDGLDVSVTISGHRLRPASGNRPDHPSHRQGRTRHRLGAHRP